MENEVWRKQIKSGATWKHPAVQEMETNMHFSGHEKEVLRRLAFHAAEIAKTDEMKHKIRLWTAHNDLKSSVPVIYVDPENGWNEVFSDNEMQCTDPLARTWEFMLRRRIYSADIIKDDTVITDTFEIPYVVSDDGWGLEIRKRGGENGGAFLIEPAINDYEEDFPKLHFPQLAVDYAASERLFSAASDVFGDILTIRRHMKWHWADDFLDSFVLLRGFENFMCDFIAEPGWLTRMMEFITAGVLRRFDFLEEQGLLFLNNDTTYVGTGGIGYTDHLPQKDFAGKVRTKDMWGTLQAQETVSVSPEMFGEYILPYFKRISESFGLVHYGCCEPYDPRWKYIKQLPNLRKVSVSAWAKWDTVPELLGKHYVASVKPSPALLATDHMDEELVRRECRRAVEETYGGICQFLMKDNHTLGNCPQNLVRWTQIMREEIERKY